VSKQLRFSRWKRLPGLSRVTEHKIPTHLAELQRLTLYLPGELLDLAEELGMQAGHKTPQRYCEDLLTQALQGQGLQEETKVQDMVKSALADAADYLYQESLDTGRDILIGLTDPVQPNGPFTLRLNGPAVTQEVGAQPTGDAPPKANESADTLALAKMEVIRHAGLATSNDTGTFLATLRLGEVPSESAADSLLSALEILDHGMASDEVVPRDLAGALYRLAYEPQVLLTEAWPVLAQDEFTLRLVRRVQAGVEQILGASGGRR